MFFFQAVKASLLPNLAGRGDLAGFRNMQLKIVAAVSALASVLAGSATASVLLRLEYSARARSA